MMRRKFARLIGLLGGIGAVIWVLRDRLISLTAPREPQPPEFRAVPPHAPPSAPPAAPAGDDLQRVKGIGPVYEQALHAYGIRSFAQLREADAAELAGELGIPTSRVVGWIDQSRALQA